MGDGAMDPGWDDDDDDDTYCISSRAATRLFQQSSKLHSPGEIGREAARQVVTIYATLGGFLQERKRRASAVRKHCFYRNMLPSIICVLIFLQVRMVPAMGSMRPKPAQR